MRLITVWREDFNAFLNDAQLLATWEDTTTQAGSAAYTWTLDGQHTVSGSGHTAHVHIVGSVSEGDSFRITRTLNPEEVAALEASTSYTFLRQAYANVVIASLPANQFNAISSTVTTDSDGEVSLNLNVVVVSGGSIDWEIWFDDVKLVKLAGTTLNFEDLLLGAGRVYVDGALFSLTHGGVDFDRGETWEQDTYPGQVEPQAGLDQLTERKPSLTTTCLQFSDYNIAAYLPGGTVTTEAGTGGTVVRQFQPSTPDKTLAEGDLLEDVIVEWPRSDGGLQRVWMPTALVTSVRVRSQDREIVESEVTFEPRKNSDDDPLYVWEREIES